MRKFLTVLLSVLMCAALSGFIVTASAMNEYGFEDADGFVHVLNTEKLLQENGKTVGGYATGTAYWSSALKLVSNKKLDVTKPISVEFAVGNYPSELADGSHYFAGVIFNEIGVQENGYPNWENAQALVRTEAAGSGIGLGYSMETNSSETWTNDGIVLIKTYYNGNTGLYCYKDRNPGLREYFMNGGYIRTTVYPEGDEYVIIFEYLNNGEWRKISFTSDWQNYLTEFRVAKSAPAYKDNGYVVAAAYTENWIGQPGDVEVSLSLKFPVNGNLRGFAFSESEGTKSSDFVLPELVYNKVVDGLELSNEEKSVNYSSANSSIATVDNSGKVAVCGLGSTVIIAENAYGRAEYALNVPVEKVNVTEEQTSLVIGGKFEIKATSSPVGGVIEYSSSDDEIAVVDKSGVVTALKEGVAVITASCADKSAAVTVTVYDEIADVSAAINNAYIKYGEELAVENVTLTANYVSGKTEILEGEISLSGYDKNVLGEQEITATLGEYSAKFTVIVIDYVVCIEAEYEGSVALGGTLDLTKLTVYEVYASGAKESGVAYVAGELDSSSEGEKSVTITAGDFTAEITVNVTAESAGGSESGSTAEAIDCGDCASSASVSSMLGGIVLAIGAAFAKKKRK